MNDFDRAGRYSVKQAPKETRGWLFPRIKPGLEASDDWLDSQSAPRPGEPDRRCDTIMKLDDQEGMPWAGVVELFTEPDADAIDRSVEYLGRFRRELRHGPYGRDRYPFVVALIFFTGAPREQRLDMNLPGMPEYGLWFGPRVMDLSEEDAIAHLDAIEQNRLGRWLLVWTPLMRGGQSIEVARRWRRLAEPDSRIRTMADIALDFARLTDSQLIWHEALEGIMLKVSSYSEEIRQEGEIKRARKDTVEVLETRFPGAVPAAVVLQIKDETNLDKLNRWHKLAITATLERFQQEM